MGYYDGPCGRDLADMDAEVEYENMQREYAYEEACMKLGILPWGRGGDGDYAFDQPD